MDKENVVYLQNGVLASHKEERNYVICSKMDRLEITMVSEKSQVQKDKSHVFSLICGILKWAMKIEENLILEGREQGERGMREGNRGNEYDQNIIMYENTTLKPNI